MASNASSRPVRNGNSQAAAADSRTPLLATTTLMFYEESSRLPRLCAFRLPSMASSHQMALKWRDEVPVVGVGKVWSRCVLMFEWYSILAQAAGATTEDVMQHIRGVFEKMLLATQLKLCHVMVIYDVSHWQVALS